jgi:hypothetical protein
MTLTIHSRREQAAVVLERLALALVLMPAAVGTVAMAGFVAGRPLGPWVLVLAAAITSLVVRAASGSWAATGRTMLVTLATYGIAAIVALAVPDGSWDGLTYQQEGILTLASGWNPVFQDAVAFAHANELFINDYPKLSWIHGAVMLLTTHRIESGKLLNLILLLAAGAQVTATLLRLSKLTLMPLLAVAALAVFNPVVVYQIATFYVDGAVACCLVILIAALASYVVTRRPTSLVVALVASSVVVNLKFTGLAYAVVLESVALLIVWRWTGLRAAYRTALAFTAAGVFAVCFIGYAPYMRNLLEHGNPVFGAPTSDIAGLRPVNLNDENRLTRFAVSTFSRTEPARAPDGTHVKWPWSIAPGEARVLYGADITVGGFGPLFGAALFLALFAAIVAAGAPATRRRAVPVLLVAACVAASMFIHAETWWARYVPQAWLVPVLIVFVTLEAPRRSLPWMAGCVLAGILAVDLILIGANVGWDETRYVQQNRASLEQLLAARPPVTVYLGPFTSLRERLSEAGVAFKVIDTPPSAPIVRHALPAPGEGAFWFDELPRAAADRNRLRQGPRRSAEASAEAAGLSDDRSPVVADDVRARRAGAP